MAYDHVFGHLTPILLYYTSECMPLKNAHSMPIIPSLNDYMVMIIRGRHTSSKRTVTQAFFLPSNLATYLASIPSELRSTMAMFLFPLV
jgi:hypothetical protein